LSVAGCASTSGEVYNLGSGEPVSLKRIASILTELCPQAHYALTPFPPEQKAIDIGSYVADVGKIQRAVGWMPRVSLRDGLTRMIEYYRAHKAEYW